MHVARQRVVTAVFLILVMAPSSAGADPQGIYVRNSSSVAVATVHVSPDYRRSWGDDRLGSSLLMPGEELRVDLPEEDDQCFFDVLIEDANGRSHAFWGLNLCRDRTVDFK
jgi:hypothetical protein